MARLTVNLDDGKLRAYPSGRLYSDDFLAMREVGFRRLRNEDCLIASWSPKGEDCALAVLGLTAADIEEDDTDLVELAEIRAERYQGYADNADGRAESHSKEGDRIVERFAFGQPILIGHHSDAGSLRDRDRADAHTRKALGEHSKASYWQDRAEAAVQRATRRYSVSALANRIKGLEADARRYSERLKEYSESAAFYGRCLDFTDARLTVAKQQMAEVVAAQGGVLTRDDIKAGDWVRYMGSWHPVVRVNAKSVTIGRWLGVETLTWKAGYHELKGHKPAEEVGSAGE